MANCYSARGALFFVWFLSLFNVDWMVAIIINHRVDQGIVVPNPRTRSFALIETAERMDVPAGLVSIALNLMINR